MNIEEVEKFLMEYTEDEKYYKKYYYCKDNEEELKKFIEDIDLNFVKENNILIPELKEFVIVPEEMNEALFFEEKNKANILIQKHYRYTPKFNHKHSFFELIYVYSGGCTQTINEDRVDLKLGDICIVSPEVEHSLGVFDDSLVINILIKRSTFNEIFFSLLTENNILSSFFTRILNSKRYNNYIIFHTGKDKILKSNILTMIDEYIHDKRYSDVILNYMLMIFLAYLLRNHEKNVELSNEINHESEKVVEILGYIQDNYKDITLGKLSKEFHFTVPYLSKIIREFTGKTFTDILKKIRMDKASNLLITTNFSVNDISYMTGYDNKEHFIRTFKKYFGIPPTQYRRKGLNKNK